MAECRVPFGKASAILVAILLGPAPTATALDPLKPVSQYVYDQWGVKEGLPHPSISCVVRTHDGYLWMGCPVGLIRFDGSSFSLYSRVNTPGLAGDNVVALMEAEDGSLWVSCMGAGLSRMRRGVFTKFGVTDGLPDAEIWSLGQDAEGSILAGTSSGLARLRDARWERIGADLGLTDGRVIRITPGPDNATWVVCDVGLRKWVGGRAVPFREEHGPGPDSRTFFWARGGEYWELRDGKMIRSKGGSTTAFPLPAGLTDVQWDIGEDRDSNVWLFSKGGGLVRLRDGRFERFVPEAGPQSRKVTSFCEDGEAGFWFGTQGGGLGRLRDGQFATFAGPEGLAVESPSGVAVDGDGGVWIEDILLRGGQFSKPAGHVGPSATDREGAVWFATSGGLVRRDRDGREQEFPQSLGREPTTLLIDRNGAIWVGRGEGLSRFERGQWAHFTAGDGMARGRVRAIAEGRDGSLWIATRAGGLCRYRGGVFEQMAGLSGVPVEALHADPEGDLWIGTDGLGLKRLRDGKLSTYTRADGLLDDSAWVIVEDRDRNLWMGSARGVARVNRRDVDSFDSGMVAQIRCRPFGLASGLRSLCVARSQHAAAIGPDGRVWFCTALGVSVVDPRAERTSHRTPPLKILEAVVDGHAFGPQGKAEAPSGAGNITFRYTALSFVDPELTRFRFTLEGFEKEFHEAGTRREAFYTNIPPGSYRFRVMACNGDGVWNSVGVVRDISIAPHLHQRWWFYPTCATLAAIAVGVGYYLRVRRLRSNERRLATLVRERTGELSREIESHRQARESMESQSDLLRQLGRELEDRNLRLSEIASTDALTGLRNRRYLDERLQSCPGEGSRGMPLSVVLVDVDHFKQFNDTHGHPAGDEVLRQVGELIQANLRDGDVAARYGGEEFVLLLPGTDAEAGRAVAERLRGAIESHAWAVRPITASLGVATLKSADAEPSDGLNRADQALYRSKRRGRNRVTLDCDPVDPADDDAGDSIPVPALACEVGGVQSANAGEHFDKLYDATVDGWVGFLDLRDHETEGHSRRVAEMTLRLARALGIGEPDLVHIRRGALLHDIGKMGVPDRILLKPGPLDPDEWRLMREHPRYAMELLSPIAFLGPALDIPYCHHERWDGGGYPRGLRGEEIPLPARIFAAVDIWDALSYSRPYREAWPSARVVEHIRGLSGSHLDPLIVSAFLPLLRPDPARPIPPEPAASNSLDTCLHFELI